MTPIIPRTETISSIKNGVRTEEVETKYSAEYLILAKARLVQLDTDEYEIVEEMSGSDLVGKSYEPPFSYFKDQEFENKANAWKVYHADYVELGEEGTGAVHLAPAYGEDDMNLAKENGVPIVHHVDEVGHFKDFVTDFAGQLVKPKDDEDSGVMHLDADIEVVKKLKENGKLFRKENITHSYPHCWRCDTPLLNYATTSWFVRVTDFKDKLVAENNKVEWVPGHVGKNRFGKWLEGARDWAVSRQRYWGAPLPVWRNSETKEYKVFGSLAELQEYVPKQGNTFLVARHSEATFNVTNTLSSAADGDNKLTEKGKEQTVALVEELKKEGVDYIYYSPLTRTAETAKLVAEGLGLSADKVVSDERLSEMKFGEFEGKSPDEYHAFFGEGEKHLTRRPEGGESWGDVKRRVGEFLYEINQKHENARVLVISHNGTIQMLRAAAAGDDKEKLGAYIDGDHYDLKNAELCQMPFVPLPHNDDYELDYHRPYIDDIELYDGETKLERVPDVFDCWFESGSMPYAETHYPFENLETSNPAEDVRFPADFIAESVDQTRGWFYSLMVLGVALFGKSPYKHVITNGLVLAEDGRKMSKSLQNYPDPMELVDRQGADSMRYYLLSSAIIKGEDLNFSEKEVSELQRKNIGRLHNVLAMYEQYADGGVAHSDSKNVLDRWILARLGQLINEATAGFKNYELDKATRPVTDFIDDLSVWYLRRSRDRLKGEDLEDKQAALATLHYVLRDLARVMAPSMPFYAEYLWQRVKEESDVESVHLANWPDEVELDPVVLGEMSIVREFVSAALELRTKANIKVRQPLAALYTNIEIEPVYAQVVADEINVKEVKFDESMTERIKLDAEITPELQQEGDAREFIRAVQDMRKKAGLEPQDRIKLTVQTTEAGQTVLKNFMDEIKRVTGTDEINFDDCDGVELAFGEQQATVKIN